MTDLLTTLIEQTMNEYHEYETWKQQEAKAEQQRKERQAEHSLRQRLEEVLSPEFLATLDFRFEHNYDSYSRKHTCAAGFSYLGVRWVLSLTGETWQLMTRPSTVSFSGVSGDLLQTRLLVEMGKRREKMEQQAQEHERYQQYCHAQEQKRIAREAREKEEREKRIHEADIEHRRLEARVTAARQQALSELWRWPEGTTIEIYQIQWCQGSYQDDEGEVSVDYESGWTASSSLDTQGRIHLEPTKRNSWSKYTNSGRTIQLMPEVHKPVWTVYQFSRVEDLPEALREAVTFQVPRVTKSQGYDLDGEERFVSVEGKASDDEYGCYKETIGNVPLPWIRTLVEQAHRSQDF